MPWNSVNLRNNGDLRVCCNANSYSKNRGILRKQDGTAFNIGRDDINDARNSSTIKDIRATMLKGEWHPECERCRQEEVNGIKSRREYEVELWDKVEQQVKDKTSVDGTIDAENIPIDYFDIRYGNFCNLKCRMCAPTDSHTWYSDFVELYNTTKFKDTHDTIQLSKNSKGRWFTDQYDWFKDSNHYWNQFEKHTKNAKKFYIVGGEPLIIEEHIDSLERLIHNGNANQISLEYNTNLTNVPKRILKLWENFRQIRIGASIDGYGEVFEYQRTPANWNSVYENLLELDRQKNINLVGWFAYTVTPFNIFHLPEFMKWKLTESRLERFNTIRGARKVVSHHMCHAPKHYNVKCLPNELKKEIDIHFEVYMQWALSQPKPVYDDFCKVLNGVSKFMNSESYYEQFFEDFLDITIKLDSIRNQDVTSIVPQLSQYIKNRKIFLSNKVIS